MAVSKYKTKKGVRYLAEVYQDGAKVGVKAGFKSRLEAHQWEKDFQQPTSISTQPDLDLERVATLYLLDVEERRKKNTLCYKKGVLKKFIKFVGPDVLFRGIVRDDIKPFLSKYAKEISRKTANKYRIELSALWSWAQIEGHASANPARQIEPFSVTKHVRYVPPKEHIAKCLEKANPFQQDFILTLLHTAARISEIREMPWEDVDLDRRVVRLWTSKRRGGDREARRIAMSDTLYSILSRLNEQRTGAEVYVFTNPLTGDQYTRQSDAIKYLFQDICKQAEVPLFTAHCLRHFMATQFNDPRRVQKILGHANLKTTENYLHDLGVDTGAASIFESITNQITNET
ncbi:site-specific integrase, partial [Desulfovibrio sp. OttesenSCG-928-G15]|nr:site-specific integrase [Desulfovibrio sp. OttesenSCG-928-G15]